MIINTKHMEATEWFDQTTGLFANTIPPMKLDSEDNWRQWADHARFFQAQVPDQRQFSDWRSWADRFNQVMG